MPIISLPGKINDYLERIKIMHDIGLSGYVFAMECTFSGPGYFGTAFP